MSRRGKPRRLVLNNARHRGRGPPHLAPHLARGRYGRTRKVVRTGESAKGRPRCYTSLRVRPAVGTPETAWLELPTEKPPWGGAPYGGAEEAKFAVPRTEVPPVRRDRPRVSKPPWTTDRHAKPCSRQVSVYQTDLPNTVPGVVKCPRYGTEGMESKVGSCEHHGNINFVSAESHTGFLRQKL